MKTEHKWTKTTVWNGVTSQVECINHSFSWSGSMPCTGMYKCMFCGKLEDENSFNGKKA